jgi:tetratricopeptide (TPR) repeat protein
VRPHAALSLLLSVAACGGRPAAPAAPLPDLPVPKLATFLPAVRDQIDAAYKRAAASPDDAEAVGRYGMVLEAYSQYDAARACYARARQLEPSSFRWAYHLALLQEAGNQRAAAIATLREALKIRPDDLPARLALASMLLASGAAEESRALAETAVKDVPGSAPSRYALGRALAALGRHAAAAGHLEEASRIAPRYAAAHYALALAYRDLGRPADGARHMEIYEKNRDAEPPTDDPLVEEVERLNAGSLVRVRQAEQLYDQGRLPEAAAEYESALALEGGDKWIHTALVSTYSRMSAWDKAEAHYRAALAIDAGFSKAHYNFALLKAERGDYRAAVDAFRKALAADPSDPATHTQLARVYELLNEPADAVRHYRLALEKDPRANQTRALLVNRLLADARGREALDEMLALLIAGDVRPEVARAALRQTYRRVGSPSQVAAYLRDARRRAEADGRADLVAAIDTELAALPGLAR